MSGRTHRSERVVICDDVSWSEPTGRGRQATADLAPPAWMASDSDPWSRDEAVPAPTRRPSSVSAGYRVDDYLDGDRDLAGLPRPRRDVRLPEPAPVLEYTGELDEESVWGPRPRLMAEEPGGRRTVVITGRISDRHVAHRSGSRERSVPRMNLGFPADRTAMWAVLLCVILLLVALTSH